MTISSNEGIVCSLGVSRSARKPDHLLQTPDTFVRAPFPGLTDSTAIIHVGPAIGARFSQYTIEMSIGGTLATTDVQRFIYVLQGQVSVAVGEKEEILDSGAFAFFPAGNSSCVRALQFSRIVVIEKPYHTAKGISLPVALIGNENDVTPQPLMDDPWLEVRSLIPAESNFDCAVNTMTFQPGAALPMLEIHVMEHGLLMLEGSGIYRLNDSWYPVQAGDFIWMAPYCPQWFAAVGKSPAKYLIYKDFNRGPWIHR